MQRGFRDGVRDLRRDRQNILFCYLLEDSLLHGLDRSGNAVLKDRIVLRLNHVVEEGLNLLCFDAVQVIADRHVEHNRIRTSKFEFLRENVDQNPCLHVFFVGLRNFKFS